MMTEMIATGMEVEQAVENAVAWILCKAITKLSDFWQCGYNRGRFKSSSVILAGLTSILNKPNNISFIRVGKVVQHHVFCRILKNQPPETSCSCMLSYISGCETTSSHSVLGRREKSSHTKNLRNYNKIAATFNSAFKPLSPRFAGERFKIEMSGGSSNVDTLNDFTVGITNYVIQWSIFKWLNFRKQPKNSNKFVYISCINL